MKRVTVEGFEASDGTVFLDEYSVVEHEKTLVFRELINECIHLERVSSNNDYSNLRAFLDSNSNILIKYLES